VKMTLKLIVYGGLVIFACVLFVAVILPWITVSDKPSNIFRTRTALEEKGRSLYIANGCTYCHTQFVRNIDWGLGAERIAQSGDYVAERPHLLGSERTGPDLSQEGGEHPDDWHLAHYTNPRFVRPESMMPSFAYLGKEGIAALTAYKQALGFKDADFRVARQQQWKKQAIEAYSSGPDESVEWLYAHIAGPWREIANPSPTTEAGLSRGKRIYQGYCTGCHGPVGDGMGPAQPYLNPPPLNFTLLANRSVSGGVLYYQIMNGITGTAMPYFKRELESEKIWDVGNYVAVTFIGRSDAHKGQTGIDAAYVGRDPAQREGK